MVKKSRLAGFFESCAKCINLSLSQDDINIEIQGWIKFSACVGFSYDFTKNMPYGILGQKGFFNLFKVIVDYTGEDIEIREKKDSISA